MIRKNIQGQTATILVALALGLVACEGPSGALGPAGPAASDGAPGVDGTAGLDGVDGAPGGIDPALPTLDKLLLGLGGQASLEAMTSFVFEASGDRLADAEGFRPDDPSEVVSLFDIKLSHEITTDSFRIDWDRSISFVGGAPLTYSEIVVGQVGVIEGIDSLFGFSSGDMSSARWASTRKQHRLFNPHLLVLEMLDDVSSVSEAGFALHDGVAHEVLRLNDSVAPIDLYVNPATGRLAKIVSRENHHFKRDVTYEVHFAGWQSYGDGPLFPSDVFLLVDDELWHHERRTSVVINGTIAASTFVFPDGAAPLYDAALAEFGRTSHQFHQNFASFGVPSDYPQLNVVATELAAGVYFLTGGSHNSMAVEQNNGVVIIEAPLYPERGDAILAWAAATFPNKPVTHAIATHHHMDHAAGLRAFVAAGATVVISEHSQPLLAEVFSAPSTIVPDALQLNPTSAIFVTVADGDSFTLADPTNPLTAWHISNVHASDMLIVNIESSAHVFNSDLWLPGNGGLTVFPSTPAALLGFIDANVGGAPTMVGGHGGVGSYAELQAFVSP